MNELDWWLSWACGQLFDRSSVIGLSSKQFDKAWKLACRMQDEEAKYRHQERKSNV